MLKATFQVTAGLIPFHPIDEYTRTFHYETRDFVKDPKGEKFVELSDKAHEYAKSIENPHRLNWVRVEFIWL